jgi:hypothetical protein
MWSVPENNRNEEGLEQADFEMVKEVLQSEPEAVWENAAKRCNL